MDIATLSRRARRRSSLLESWPQPVVEIGMGTCGRAAGADDVLAAVRETLERVAPRGRVVPVGCLGLCYLEPLMAVRLPGEPFVYYGDLTAERAAAILTSCLEEDDVRPELALCTVGEGEIDGLPDLSELPMMKPQVRIALRNCGLIDPERIEHSLARGGYQGLQRALRMRPEEVVEEIKASGLRGRGGAGFPTGAKWEIARAERSATKVVVCNADEGDPGAFMDRSLLEGDPHAVLEGMLIAAYATGAEKGFLYVRAEYPLAVRRLRTALAQMTEYGLLGRDILGSGFDFDIRIREGAGAFVCGEETALIASIQGGRGTPRPRPPYPTQSGVRGWPTTINNVETLANVSAIMEKGAGWFSRYGTETSRGTKTFSLAGNVQRTGLIEVPMGITLGEIVFDIGGGGANGRQIKAVQTGGPSGGCIPIRLRDLPVDYESLAGVGSIMGSGGLVVMDENTCMVDMARYFLTFTQSESCGKCMPCRLGTRSMLETLEAICSGDGHPDDLKLLRDLSEAVKKGSLCGLGQSAPNPVLSTLTHFADEYEAHITEKRCPAAVCKPLLVSPCQHSCPVGVDVPRYVAAIAEGDYGGAVDIIRERNPFPSVCGRICHHPCESHCRRGELDRPVSIRALKRFAADWYFEHEPPAPAPFLRTRRERVAVIGSGPGGLACAFFLAQQGYGVKVFEALPVAGGMLTVALPEFRLPRAVIEREIDDLVARGIEIECDAPVADGHGVDDLLREGYSAVFIAAGATRSRPIGIPGEADGLEGLLSGLPFLEDVRLGRPVQVGRRVAVIGGGNVALDSARTALRLGAREVRIFYRRSREEMPVSDAEYDQAREEGVEVEFLVAPTSIVDDDGRVSGLHVVRMDLGEPDASGRRRPVPRPGSEGAVEADTVIVTVGQEPDLGFLAGDGIAQTRWGTLKVDPNTLATNVPGVFAGGDCVTGPGMVIDAIAAGRRAAVAIEKYLAGDDSPVDLCDRRTGPPAAGGPAVEGGETLEPRRDPPLLDVPLRCLCFDEVELDYEEADARREAGRCLRCDLEEA